MLIRNLPPGTTMFERCVILQQDFLEIGRRYVHAFGVAHGVSALIEDTNEGRLPWDKAQQVLGYMHYVFIEHIARRVGHTNFSALCRDPEFITMQADSLSSLLQRYGPIPQARYMSAIESFTWDSLRHWHFVAHDLGGRYIYEITPKLAQFLRPSEGVEVPWQSPRMPVPALLMLVPPEVKLTLKVEGFPPRDVTEIYAVESPSPGHQWAVWIHAPISETLAESVYLAIPFSEGGSFEEGLARTHDMLRDAPPSVEGWKECVRWFAASMRYLAEGGAHEERCLDPDEVTPGRRYLLGAPEGLH